jgi:hypothetical protein
MSLHVSRLPIGVDLLIGEAKKRTRRRRLLLAAVLAGVVALAVGLTFALRPGAGAHGAWIPQGVEEIDVKAPPISRRITAPSEVKRVVVWFDELHRVREVKIHGIQLACAGGYAANVVFTFRGANGEELAKATGTPDVAWACGTIQFAAGAQPAAFLVDGNGAPHDVTRAMSVMAGHRSSSASTSLGPTSISGRRATRRRGSLRSPEPCRRRCR